MNTVGDLFFFTQVWEPLTATDSDPRAAEQKDHCPPGNEWVDSHEPGPQMPKAS